MGLVKIYVKAAVPAPAKGILADFGMITALNEHFSNKYIKHRVLK